MSAHTPESWSVLDNRENPYAKGQVHVIAGGGLTVATITYQAPDANGETERMANARLIAAAPDLLGALSFLTAHCRRMGFDTREEDPLLQDAEAAIAKATGSHP